MADSRHRIDELIVRSLQRLATPAEEERLQTWRAAAPANERRFSELRELWTLLGEGAPTQRGAMPDPDELIARANVAQAAEEAAAATALRWARRTRTASLLAAAAGIAAVAFGIGLQMQDNERPSFLAGTEIVTAAGEMTTLTLADGSSIRLGPQSRIRLAETADQRIAYLEGRAFFGVQTDSTLPFVVLTPQGAARVLGTRFEVRSDPEAEEFRVLVVEGEVAVAAGGSELRLREGELTRSIRGAPLDAERVDNVYSYLDWLGDALVFQRTPLTRALDELERRYGLVVDLRDPGLAELTVTATFTGQPVEDVVFVLCEIANAPCLIENDTIRIGRNGGQAQRLNAISNQ